MVVERTIGLTTEEINRFRRCADQIIGLSGRVDLLTSKEQLDLEQLLKKSMLAQAVFTEAELKSL
jgi:hypothetical protein